MPVTSIDLLDTPALTRQGQIHMHALPEPEQHHITPDSPASSQRISNPQNSDQAMGNLIIQGVITKTPPVIESSLHSHAYPQLIYPTDTAITLEIDGLARIASSSVAIVVPAFVEHRLLSGEHRNVACLLFSAPLANGPQSKVIRMNSFLRQLILRTAIRYTESDLIAASRLGAVLLDELEERCTPVEAMPMPTDRRLQHLVIQYMSNPGSKLTLRERGKLVGMSERTIIRLFHQETGLTFGAWCRRYHVETACERIRNFDSIGDIARSLGYAYPSDFSSIFRELKGLDPKQYQRTLHAKVS